MKRCIITKWYQKANSPKRGFVRIHDNFLQHCCKWVYLLDI